MELSLSSISVWRLRLPTPPAGCAGIAALLGCLCLQQQATLISAVVARIGLLVALIVLLACVRSPQPAARWFSLAAVALLFAMNGQLSAIDAISQRLNPADEGRTLRLVGLVEQMPIAFDRGLRFVFRVEQCDALATGCVVGSRFRLAWYNGAAATRTPLRPGQRWRLTVQAKQVHGLLNPGLFDAELRAMEDGIAALGTVRSGVLDSAQDSALVRLWTAPLSVIEQVRLRLRRSMLQAAHGANPIAAGVSIALVIGDQSAIGTAQWNLFNRTGVGHLMSISGLHITMLAGISAFVIGRLWRSSWFARLVGGSPSAWLMRPLAQRLAAVATAFAYSALAGWGVPAQRTCWMLLAAALAGVFGRTGSPLAVVSFALLPVLWFDPWACGSAGFWLSFCAVASIIWYGDRQIYRVSRWRSLREGLRSQYAVSLALLPLGALFFSSLSLVGPLANTIAIPLVSFVVTPLSLLAALLSLISTSLAGWLLWLPLLLSEWLILLLAWLDRFAAVHVLPYPDAAALLCSSFGLVVLLSTLVPGRAIASFALLPILLKPIARPVADELWLTVFDVGQGMTVLVESHDGRLLYDAGPAYGGDNDAGARVLTPYLRSRGIHTLDMLVLSHQDRDHVGGARALLRNFVVPQLRSSIDGDDPLLRQARAKGIDVQACRRGAAWYWGQVRFEFLHPGEQRAKAQRSQSNANSCVLRVESPAGSLLLTGDIEAAQEKWLAGELAPRLLKSTLLLAPHHGSQSSSSAPFLQAVRPEFAVFQVGYRNRFKHPHPKVLARYLDSGARLLRTDVDGAISIRFNPNMPPIVERLRIDEPRYWRVCVNGADTTCPREN